MGHELGHWKLNHLTKNILINTIYMLLYGLILIPFVDNQEFLVAFNIRMESYFLLLALYSWLYLRTIDIPVRWGINWLSRRFEYEADAFAVKIGYAKAA